MKRTAIRPLPAGRLTARQVIVFGAATLVIGVVELILAVNLVTAGVALATWVVYVLVYTPLKTRSPLNTAVGAVSGALPILIGWTATGAPIDTASAGAVGRDVPVAVSTFHGDRLVVPRRIRASGPANVDGGRSDRLRAGAQAVVGALALVPVSLVPAMSPQAGSPAIYSFWTLALGGMQVAAAAVVFGATATTAPPAGCCARACLFDLLDGIAC